MPGGDLGEAGIASRGSSKWSAAGREMTDRLVMREEMTSGDAGATESLRVRGRGVVRLYSLVAVSVDSDCQNCQSEWQDRKKTGRVPEIEVLRCNVPRRGRSSHWP